jgi:VCBS repeat-containing protein
VAPGFTLTATVVTYPAHGTVTLLPDGNFTYTPTANFSGSDSFTYRASAGTPSLTSDATVTITVTPVNDPPVAVNDTAATTVDQLLVVPAPGVLANDTDVDSGDSKTVVAVNGLAAAVGTQITLPSGALLAMQPDGSYWYDPHGQFGYLAVGQSATDTFSYTMRDRAGATSSAQVAITITRTAAANSIQGSVYVDVNNDGVRQAAELGLPQVLVRLEGPVVRSIRTDDAGHYQFNDLPDGTYVLWEYHPQSFLDGKDTPGTPLLGTAGNDRFTGLVMAGGLQAVNYNFGERGLKNPSKALELASTNTHDILMGLMAIDEPPTLEAQLDQAMGNGLVGVRNLRNPLDVSDDGSISPVDALMIINLLNNPQVFAPKANTTLAEGLSSPPYYDTNGDGRVSPVDALIVINYLNSKAAASGEGEAAAALQAASMLPDNTAAENQALD